MQLSLTVGRLGPLSSDCAVTVALEPTKEFLDRNTDALQKAQASDPKLAGKVDPNGDAPPWYPSEKDRDGVLGDRVESGTLSLYPVRRMGLGPIAVELYLEEGKNKQKLRQKK